MSLLPEEQGDDLSRGDRGEEVGCEASEPLEVRQVEGGADDPVDGIVLPYDLYELVDDLGTLRLEVDVEALPRTVLVPVL